MLPIIKGIARIIQINIGIHTIITLCFGSYYISIRVLIKKVSKKGKTFALPS